MLAFRRKRAGIVGDGALRRLRRRLRRSERPRPIGRDVLLGGLLTMRHRVVVCLMLAAALASTAPFAGPTVAQQPTVTENDCSALVLFGTDQRPALGDITCGTLTVPENWYIPSGRQIAISYVVLRSTNFAPQPDPVVYLEGGPGGSALLRSTAYARTFARLRQQRDVILFDQRGTGRSSPLECSRFASFDDLFGAFRAPGEAAPADAEAVAGESDVLLAAARTEYLPDTAHCARELFTRGVDLTQYNSRASANDVVALVNALGYERYNLYGISYGTRLALVLMRDHARGGLRSVVLDSTYPPNLPGYEQTSVLPYEVAMQFFADCALDPVCSVVYPDLKDRFVALLERLETAPVAAPDGTSVTAADVAEVLRSISNDARMVPHLPRMIAELEQGTTETYQGIISGAVFAADVAGAAAAPPPTAPPASQPDATGGPPPEATPGLFAAADGTPSPAQRWLQQVQVGAKTLPGDYAAAALQLLIMLDKLPRERATLAEFVERAFVGPEQAVNRESLLAEVEALTDDDVRDVFALVAEAPDLIDAESVGINLAMFNSVECHEAIRFESFEDAVAAARALPIPALASPLEVVAAQFVRCEVWPSGTAPDVEGHAVVSDVPTLLMAGAYDAQTPVSWSKLVFLSLPNAYWAFFPMSGHGTIFYSACAEEVGAAFVARPDQPPDLSCAAELEPSFVLPPGGSAPATPAPPA
jgi:pimeloyl-ACP methyl ester carboxylesterase